MTIEEICFKYNINNYTINDDGSIDVDDHVFLDNKKNPDASPITELPLRFNKVTKNFYCQENALTDLKGCPKEVGGSFYCDDNSLTTLKGGPEKVGKHFSIKHNLLTSLEFAPKSVGEDFIFQRNLLTTLKGCPKEIGGDINCQYNKLTSFEFGPEKVGGNFTFDGNQIENFDFTPNSIKGNMYFNGNPIGFIFSNVDMDFLRAFKAYRILKDNVINLKRLKYLTDEYNRIIRLDKIKKHYIIR